MLSKVICKGLENSIQNKNFKLENYIPVIKSVPILIDMMLKNLNQKFTLTNEK